MGRRRRNENTKTPPLCSHTYFCAVKKLCSQRMRGHAGLPLRHLESPQPSLASPRRRACCESLVNHASMPVASAPHEILMRRACTRAHSGTRNNNPDSPPCTHNTLKSIPGIIATSDRRKQQQPTTVIYTGTNIVLTCTRVLYLLVWRLLINTCILEYRTSMYVWM